MSEDAAKEDKTEDPSPRRLQQAYGDGQVPLSKETSLWGGLAGGALALVAVGTPLRDALVTLVTTGARSVASPDMGLLLPPSLSVLRWTLVVAAAAALGGALAIALQTGGRFWPQQLVKGAENIFSGGPLKRVFSRQMAMDLLLSVVRVLTLGAVVYFSLRDDFMTLPRLLDASAGGQLARVFSALVDSGVKLLAALAVFAGLDFALTRRRFHENMKMTKEEAKREMREDEGDPLIRGRRRRRHRELMKGRAQVEVPRADVLLVNPTHIAICLRYRPGKDRAPIVTAKGKGALAEHMRDLARSHGIPIVENIPLARLLHKKVKVGRAVPTETYKAVAAVLAFVYRITRRAPAVVRNPQVGASL